MANQNNTFAVLIEKANGEYGLISSTSSSDYDRGDYQQAVDKAKRAIAVKRDNWQQTFYLTERLRLAEISFNHAGAWELVSLI